MNNNNTVEIAVRLALDQFKTAVGQLETVFDGAMTSVETEAALAGGVLEESFKTLGVKSVASVEAEVQKLQVALGIIRNMPGVLPADAERATQVFNQRLTQLRAEINGVPPAANQMSGAVNDTAAALGNAAHKALAWAAAIAGVNSLGDLAKQVIETGSAYEQLEGRLTSLLGSQQASAEAFAQIKQIAATTPFEVTAITDAYAKLTAFGLQPTEEQMRSMLDTAASLGGGTQMLERVTLALGQAWTKGKLQGGEIMQMAEAGVPVWDMLANATGKNVGELQRMSEAGQLGREAIKQLIDEMGRQNAGASAELMDTYAGAVSNAKDALSEFYAMIAQSGVLDYLKIQIQSVLAEFERMKETGELEAKAKAIADAFLNFADAVKFSIEALQSLSGVIVFALEAFAATRVISFASALRTMAASATAGSAALTTVATSATAAGTAATTAAAGVGLLGKALGALKVVGVIGAIEAVTTLAGKFFEARRAAEETDQAVAKLMAPTPMPIKDQVEALAATTNNAAAAVGNFEAAFNAAFTSGKASADALADAIGKIDFSSVKGVADFLAGMDALRAKAKITAQEFEDGIGKSLEKMTTVQLREFGLMAQMAFQQGEISARALDAALNGALKETLRDTGQDINVLTTGMTKGFQEAGAQLGFLIEGVDRMKDAGIDAGSAIEGGIINALKKVSNGTELEALKQQLKTAGIEGDKAGASVEKAFADAQRRIEDMEPGIQSVNEAFRTLGMKTPEELRKIADTAKEAFETIKQSGTATPRQIEEAFLRYAQAAIAANGGVADSMLKAKAESMGLVVQVGRAGDEIVRAADATGGLQSGLSGATAEARRLKQTVESIRWPDDGMARDESGNIIQQAVGGSPQNVIKDLPTDQLQRAIDGLAVSLGGLPLVINPQQAQEELQRRTEEDSRAIAERERQREDAARAREERINERVAHRETMRVTLQAPNGRASFVDVADRSQAEEFINVLRDAGMTTFRG